MIEYAAILGTLAGVIVGGFVNFLSSRRVKQQEWLLSLARDQINRREGLYADYLAEIHSLTLEGLYRPLELPKDVMTLDRMLAQMTLLSPEPVLQAARDLRRHLVRKRSTASEMLEDRPDLQALIDAFVRAARTDLQSLST